MNENVSTRRSFTLPRNSPAYYEEISDNPSAYRQEEISRMKSSSLPRNLDQILFHNSGVQDYLESEFLTQDLNFTSNYAKQYGRPASQNFDLRETKSQNIDSDFSQTNFEAENDDFRSETVEDFENGNRFFRQKDVLEGETTYRNFSDLDLDERTLRGIDRIHRTSKLIFIHNFCTSLKCIKIKLNSLNLYKDREFKCKCNYKE